MKNHVIQEPLWYDLCAKTSFLSICLYRKRDVPDISEAEAEAICGDVILNHAVVTEFGQRLIGIELEGVVQECTVDVSVCFKKSFRVLCRNARLSIELYDMFKCFVTKCNKRK